MFDRMTQTSNRGAQQREIGALRTRAVTLIFAALPLRGKSGAFRLCVCCRFAAD